MAGNGTAHLLWSCGLRRHVASSVGYLATRTQKYEDDPRPQALRPSGPNHPMNGPDQWVSTLTIEQDLRRLWLYRNCASRSGRLKDRRWRCRCWYQKFAFRLRRTRGHSIKPRLLLCFLGNGSRNSRQFESAIVSPRGSSPWAGALLRISSFSSSNIASSSAIISRRLRNGGLGSLALDDASGRAA